MVNYLGKTQESDKEKIARLERENAELAQRLKDVSNLVESSKLSEYMKKNNVSWFSYLKDLMLPLFEFYLLVSF